MFVAYDGIVFDVLYLNGWNQEAVFSEDGADFLYWHHVIDVTAIINPNVLAFHFIPPVNKAPLNATLKTAKKDADQIRTVRTKKAQGNNLLPKDTKAPSGPTPSKIPPTYKPRSDLNPDELKDFQNLLILGTGDIAQKADQDPSYPTRSEIIPGVPYLFNLNSVTAPVSEVGASEWVESKFTPTAGPTAFNATSTGTEGTDPASQIPTPPVTIPVRQLDKQVAKYVATANAAAAAPGVGGGGFLGSALDWLAQRAKQVVASTDRRADLQTAVGAKILGGSGGTDLSRSLPNIKNVSTRVQQALDRQAQQQAKQTEVFDKVVEKVKQQQPKPPDDGPQRAKRKRWPGNANLPATDIELRDRLQVPRRPFQVWVNTGPGGAPEFIINLPYEDCTVDANNGPRCVDMNMVAIHGNVTGVKRLTFECFEALPLYSSMKAQMRVKSNTSRMSSHPPLKAGIFPAGLGIGGLGLDVVGGAAAIALQQRDEFPPLLSNRWTMAQKPDPQTFLNTTEITGKAVFRMDALSKLKITADQLRQYIMPPVATGYIRRPPEVTIGSLGNEVLYSIVDDQQMMNNPAGLNWGVHSAYVTVEMSANNPVDMMFKGGPQRPNDIRSVFDDIHGAL